MKATCAGILTLTLLTTASADEWKPIARVLPPAGIEIKDEDRLKLTQEADKLRRRLQDFQKADTSPETEDLIPDIEMYVKAVLLALEFGEFYGPKDVGVAEAALNSANQRLDQLAAGKHDWTKQRGLLARGYRSDIDGSAQPYGLVIPEELDLEKPAPLYVWLHGRGDKETDLHFISHREKSRGEVHPQDAIVMHAFGRGCIGFKSAGEIDVLDAVASVKKRYNIDPERIVLMGFSMGGAGSWHIGAHYADRWVAVSPGAGFVDVARYQNITPDKYPPIYEQKLWGVYDVPDYVRNLFNVPLIAYSGELDKQKAAADLMAEAFKAEGREMPHIIGPCVAHKYQPDALAELLAKLKKIVETGRDTQPKQVSLQTRTLRYNRVHWVSAEGLDEHWKDARIDAELQDSLLKVTTKNVSSLRLSPAKSAAKIEIDGESVAAAQQFEKVKGHWTPSSSGARGLAKSPGLQGPIDDAFLESFLVVTPTGKSQSEAVDRWVQFELNHFLTRWRALYRGEPRVKKDTETTPQDAANYHLIVWGDPSSNQVFKKLAGELPIAWDEKSLRAGGQSFAADHHAAALIVPNPRAPGKYVVFNSGPTHREGHDRTNSLQNPKLPDWAIIDVTTPPDAEKPGKVVAADFFDEQWRIKPTRDRADTGAAGSAVANAPASDNKSAKPAEARIITSEFVYNEPPTPQCHASTIAETPTGLVAAWFGGTREGDADVEIWVARRAAGGWSKPVSVADGRDGERRYPCWNPVLFQEPQGSLLLFYKVGPSPSGWWGMLTSSEDGGKTWATPQRLPKDILGPIKNKPALLPDGALLCPTSTEHDGWQVHLERRGQDGAFTKTDALNDGHTIAAIQPSILTHGAGKLQILCRTKQGKLAESWSNDGGKTWSDMTLTELPNPNSGTDAVTLADGRHLLVYNPVAKGRTPLSVAISEDGRRWRPLITLEDEKGEFSYPAIIQAADGAVHIAYTWKRQKVKHVALEVK